MATMQMSIEGQLNSMSFSKNKILWPLFETVVNAIQSIDDSENKQCGKITIMAHRENVSQINLSGNEELARFDYFSVEDNGNGFNDSNMKSFNEAYSTLKLTKGCKGIGRFLWLKLFSNVTIESNFKENNDWYKRKFNFNDTKGIDFLGSEDGISTIKDDTASFSTVVTLENIRPNYRDKITKDLERMARSIIEHCLLYFLSPTCPLIILKDSDGNEYNLNDMYNNTIRNSTSKVKFEIKGHEFTLCNMKKYTGEKHELHYCANKREVQSKKLNKQIPNLQTKLKGVNEESFYYQGYIISEYLDDIVSHDRTRLDFPDGEDLFDGVEEDEIIKKAIPYITDYLSDILKEVAKTKKELIDEYVNNHKPQYRYLLSNFPQVYDQIPSNAQEDTIEQHLHKATQKWETDIFKQTKDIEAKIKNSNSLPENFQELVNEYSKKVSDISRASLTEYIVRRRSILTLLKEGIARQSNDKFNKEEYIHNLIYPMRSTSDDVPEDSHNLWLIDERLSYCAYIASDCELERNKERPDILFLDNPIALSEQNDTDTYDSIVIVELKRPMRDDYDANKNPYMQLLNYVKKIRSNKAKDRRGRLIKTHERTKFYLYAICDINAKLDEILTDNSFSLTPDGIGRFLNHDKYNAYIEVIPLDKLVNDAIKRNRILFDKLFSPNIERTLKNDLLNNNS